VFPRMPNAPGLTERVASALLGKIQEGAFPPGARLPSENDLADQFGVSRTVLREAISRLKHEGVVEGRQGSGVFVTEQARVKPLRIEIASVESPEAILNIIELRRAIEGEAASQAALKCTNAQILEIDNALKRIDKDEAAGKDGVAADLAFHGTIAKASGNPFIVKTLEFLSQYLETASRVTRANDARRADFLRQLREEHAAIATAIHNRDPFAARNAAEAHMFNGARRLTEAMATVTSIEERKSSSGR
jgi:GntR family transcriptional regulator, transcriptional repressor for pyruvate dehydrogenase complex